MQTRLWFIRHGEVEAPYVGTFVGRTDVGLSDVGRHQAEAVSHFLEDAPLDHILSSPRKRALDTAAPTVKARDGHVEIRDGMAEMDFGDWEGLAWDEIALRDEAYAELWQSDPTVHPCPGGESAGAFYTRVQAALSDLIDEFRGRHVALFAHAGVNRAIMADILGRPYMESFAFAQDYGNVNAAGWDHDLGFTQIAMLNFVPGPRSQDQGDGNNR